MTAYNRLNGEYCTDRRDLLQGILRDEWGFEGFVITDWFGAGSTATAIEAGVDLEMPGPGRFYGPALAEAVRNGDVDESTVTDRVTHLLRTLDRVGAFDDPPGALEESLDRPEHRALAREAAVGASVLLTNDGVLHSIRARSARSPSSAPTPTVPRSWAAARRHCARTTS